MHSLPSRRRLPQSNFFRFKCYRLSSSLLLLFLLPATPPSLPAAAPPASSLFLFPLPDTHVPVRSPPLVSAVPHALALVPPRPAAVDQQTLRPRPVHGQTHTPGTVRQTQRDDGAVRCQSRRTFPEGSNRDLVTAPRSPRHRSRQLRPQLPTFRHSLMSALTRIPERRCSCRVPGWFPKVIVPVTATRSKVKAPSLGHFFYMF